MSRRIYLSGPITGTTDYVERFAAYVTYLIFNSEEGVEVVNPIALYESLKKELGCEPSYEQIMAVDLEELPKCDTIALMPHWEKSDGCRREVKLAADNGLVFMYLRELERA